MAEVNEGSVVDNRYRVLRRLGSGGMADVWLAEDTHLQRQVALKILHRRFLQDQEFVGRFQREAEHAAGLTHPNIVAVYDRGSDGDVNYIAMRYVEGPTLKELIDRGLSPDQAVALVRQVLEGARFAHRNGIVHRDLKPQNVIVDEEGKAVVTDFGIARAGVSEITQTGSVMGTPQYLSPEQAQGFEVTPVSDLYSIGVILYEALTRRVPFEADSAVAIAMKQVAETPQRPSSINPQVSPALDAVVMRALEKEPGQRFQSADAFIAALDAALKDPGVSQGTAAFAAVAPVAEELPPEEDRKRNSWLWGLLVAAILIGLLIGWALSRDTTTDVPNVTNKQLEFAISQLERKGFTVGEEKYVNRAVPRNTVLEQDPLPGLRRRRLLLPHLLLLEADRRSDDQRRAGQRRSALDRGAERGGGDRKAGRRRLRSRRRTGQLQLGRGRDGGPLRTRRRHHRDQRLDRDPVRLPRAEADQGAGAGRQPARRRGRTAPRPRPRTERRPKKKAPPPRAR